MNEFKTRELNTMIRFMNEIKDYAMNHTSDEETGELYLDNVKVAELCDDIVRNIHGILYFLV